jgi:hypothetical protein
MSTETQTSEQVRRIIALAKTLPNTQRAELLDAIAGLVGTLQDPWPLDLAQPRFSSGHNAPADGRNDKVDNDTRDNAAKYLRREAEAARAEGDPHSKPALPEARS